MHPFGYMGNLLRIDISERTSSLLPSNQYTERFLGGRGLAAGLSYELVPPDTDVFAPQNCLMFVNGPLAGFHGLGGNRWQICGKARVGGRETFSYANLGGKWGAMLKYAGYDGLAVSGQAERPVYIVINEKQAEIKSAAHLWGKTTYETCELLQAEHGKNVSVLTIGPAAEHLVAFASVLTDDGSSGAGGLACVMGSKKLKAIVVYGRQRPRAARPDTLKELVLAANRMREISFAHAKPWDITRVTKRKNCYGCSLGCSRHSYQFEGKTYKSFCQAAVVYTHSIGGHFSGVGHEQQLATRLCDAYGLDTTVVMGTVSWLQDCYREGIIHESDTNLPLNKPGSAELIEMLTHKLAFREDIGDILAEGPLPAARRFGKKAEALLNFYISTAVGETKDYDPRLIPSAAILYATEPRRPIQQLHELSIILKMWLKWAKGDADSFFTSDDFFMAAEVFLGSRAAADFTTYDGKALCAKIIQDRAYAKESLILCDFIWPMKWTLYPGGHVGDPTLESRILSAVTGCETDEKQLNLIGERVFNLQRALALRMGWPGREGDRLLDYYYHEPLKEGEIFFTKKCEVMGPDGKPVSKLGHVLTKTAIDGLFNEYYKLRGWDTHSGLPYSSTLTSLGLPDIAEDLAKSGLLLEK